MIEGQYYGPLFWSDMAMIFPVVMYMIMAIFTGNAAYDSIEDIPWADETWEMVAIGFVGIIWPLFWLTVAYALIVQWKNE